MVDMIRGASGAGGSSLDARIDSANKKVIIAPPNKSSHRVVIEHTRDIVVRSGILNNNLESLLSEQSVYVKKQLHIS